MFQQNVRVFSERPALVTIIPSQTEGIIKLDLTSHSCGHILQAYFRNKDTFFFFSFPGML